MPIALHQTKGYPYSVFALEFPVTSTCVVMGFLESKLPGVTFLAYRRDDGVPTLDNIIFGEHSDLICNHPLEMRVNEDAANPLCKKGSSILGFDLRLARDVEVTSSVTADGTPTFDINSGDVKLQQWWEARMPLFDRVKALTGLDPTAMLNSLLGNADERESRSQAGNHDSGFQEGGKKVTVSDASTAPSSRDTSAGSPPRNLNHQPDLKDADMLMRCRSVIVDLGNACWTHRHFSEDIQTRQYRAPEVIIGSNYDTSADIWSLGCMIFELLTGDLLFDPRAGEDYDRDEDHLAMFQELLGKMPKRIALEGKYAKNFFDKRGSLKHIKQLKFWPLQEVLTEKYHFPKEEANAIADFIRPLLDFDPKTRITALDALNADWLKS